MWKILILCLISFVCSRNIDPRCTIPNTRPTQNLPHESTCSLFYKCHNGYLLLLSCPKGWIFHEYSSTCIQTGNNECVRSEPTITATKSFTIPTPPTITSGSTITSTVSSTIPTAPTISDNVSIDPDLIPFPTHPILTTIPTPPTITLTQFTIPTPPNINN